MQPTKIFPSLYLFSCPCLVLMVKLFLNSLFSVNLHLWKISSHNNIVTLAYYINNWYKSHSIHLLLPKLLSLQHYLPSSHALQSCFQTEVLHWLQSHNFTRWSLEDWTFKSHQGFYNVTFGRVTHRLRTGNWWSWSTWPLWRWWMVRVRRKSWGWVPQATGPWGFAYAIACPVISTWTKRWKVRGKAILLQFCT